MALNIKDPETDRLARELAQLTGETLTEAVAQVLRDRIERERRRRGKSIDREEVMKIARRLASRPVLDDRSPDEILGYDKPASASAGVSKTLAALATTISGSSRNI